MAIYFPRRHKFYFNYFDFEHIHFCVILTTLSCINAHPIAEIQTVFLERAAFRQWRLLVCFCGMFTVYSMSCHSNDILIMWIFLLTVLVLVIFRPSSWLLRVAFSVTSCLSICLSPKCLPVIFLNDIVAEWKMDKL